MLDFLWIFCFVGLPVFVPSALYLWKPGVSPTGHEDSIAIRIAWTVVALGVSAALCFPMFLLPLMIVGIWKPDRRPWTNMDRLAWTVFALGVSLMLTMAVLAKTQESDGDWRSWDTIRLHTRIFLGLSIIPVAGPLVVYLVQATRKRTLSVSDKKPPVDDWGEADRPIRS